MKSIENVMKSHESGDTVTKKQWTVIKSDVDEMKRYEKWCIKGWKGMQRSENVMKGDEMQWES